MSHGWLLCMGLINTTITQTICHFYCFSFYFWFLPIIVLSFLQCDPSSLGKEYSSKILQIPFSPKMIQKGSRKSHVSIQGTGHVCLHRAPISSSISKVLMLPYFLAMTFPVSSRSGKPCLILWECACGFPSHLNHLYTGAAGTHRT